MDAKTEKMIALGVAYGINCKFCMEYHKEKAIAVGLTQQEMLSAIQVAEGVKMGAHNKTKGYAKDLFGEVGEPRCCPAGSECCPDSAETENSAEGMPTANSVASEPCGCGAAPEFARADVSKTAQPRELMMGMMSKMMDTCGSHGQSAGATNTAEKKPAVNPATSEGCGCG